MGRNAEIEQFVSVIRADFTPPARAEAVAATIRQVLDLLPDWDIEQLAKGWTALAPSRDGDDAATTARRKTCSELAAATAKVVSSARLAAVQANIPCGIWRKLKEHFESLSARDPRHAVMAATFTREWRELGGMTREELADWHAQHPTPDLSPSGMKEWREGRD